MAVSVIVLIIGFEQRSVGKFIGIIFPVIGVFYTNCNRPVNIILDLGFHNPVFQPGSTCFILLNNTGRQVFKYPLPPLCLIDRRRQCLFEFIAFAKQLPEILVA